LASRKIKLESKISCPAADPSEGIEPANQRACILNKRRLFENRSVYVFKTSIFGVVILQPLACRVWMWSTRGLRSIYSSAIALPL
jgi:hypothetical protein